MPSLSILAEPPVAVVDKVAIRRGTTAEARAYLEYLYSREGQEIVGPALLPAARPGSGGQVRRDVPEVNLVTIADFGGWAKAQATHFADGGTFDRIYRNERCRPRL